MDFSQLTDAELREALKGHGVSVGPIVASTRKVYEKKLLKLASGNINNLSQSNIDDSLLNGTALLETEISVTAAPLSPKKATSPTRTPPKRPVQTTKGETTESDSDDCEESMRYLTEEEMAADRAAARRSLQSNNRGSYLTSSITISVLFLFIAVFAYYLIENAEQLKLLSEQNADDAI